MASQYVPSSHATRAAQALWVFGVTEIVFFSKGKARGSYCWLPPTWVNQTQADRCHGRNLEPPFPFDLANPGERKIHLSAWVQILSRISRHAQRPDIIGFTGNVENINIRNTTLISWAVPCAWGRTAGAKCSGSSWLDLPAWEGGEHTKLAAPTMGHLKPYSHVGNHTGNHAGPQIHFFSKNTGEELGIKLGLVTSLTSPSCWLSGLSHQELTIPWVAVVCGTPEAFSVAHAFSVTSWKRQSLFIKLSLSTILQWVPSPLPWCTWWQMLIPIIAPQLWHSERLTSWFERKEYLDCKTFWFCLQSRSSNKCWWWLRHQKVYRIITSPSLEVMPSHFDYK